MDVAGPCKYRLTFTDCAVGAYRFVDANIVIGSGCAVVSTHTAASAFYVAWVEASKLEIVSGVTCDANGARGMNMINDPEISAISHDITNTDTNLGLIPRSGTFRTNLANASGSAAWMKNFTSSGSYLGIVHFSDGIMSGANGTIR